MVVGNGYFDCVGFLIFHKGGLWAVRPLEPAKLQKLCLISYRSITQIGWEKSANPLIANEKRALLAVLRMGPPA